METNFGEPKRLRTLDLFAGIGGFSLGLERTGWFSTTKFCEISSFSQQVLKKNWPRVPVHHDIRDLHVRPGEFDVVVGGPPCQDVSVIGTGRGLLGPKSSLWFEFERIISEATPRYVLVENVAALRGRGLDRVLRSLLALGYDAEWHVVPASAVGAPHQRDRTWVVAYPQGCGIDGREERLSGQHHRDAGQGSRPGGVGPRGSHWEAEPQVGRVADGFPGGLDRHRRHALGNAIVPQVVEQVIAPILIRIEQALRVRERWERSINDNAEGATQMMVALGRELPPRISFPQALIFALVLQAHADRRDIRVSDLPVRIPTMPPT